MSHFVRLYTRNYYRLPSAFLRQIRSNGPGLIALARSFAANHSARRAQNRMDRLYVHSQLLKVCVTLKRGSRTRACWSASAASVEEALRQAVARALADERFGGRIRPEELNRLTFELWVQTSRRRLRAIDQSLLWGDRGVEIHYQSRTAFFLPCVGLTARRRDPSQLLRQLCTKAGLGESDYRAPGAKLFTTTWHHVAETPLGVCELRRCRPVEDTSIGPRTVVNSALRAAMQMVSLQRADGDYTYLYHAAADHRDNQNVNLVRTVGTAYAMSRLVDYLWRNNPDLPLISHLRQSAYRSLDAVARRTSLLPDGTSYHTSDDPDGRGALGCTAMAILALQSSWVRRTFSTVRDDLVRSVLNLQADEGWFPQFVRDSANRGNQDFFPGETLLALAREYRLRPTNRIVRAMLLALPFYRHYFRSNPSPYFAAWHAKAWSTFLTGFACPEAETFVLELLDWLRQWQYHRDEVVPADFVGGFFPPEVSRGSPPTFITAVFTEAFACGIPIARMRRDQRRAAMYTDVMMEGVAFLLRLQLRAETAFHLPNPTLAVGGVTKDLTSFEIRCDYNMHAITCLLEVSTRLRA